MHQASYRWTVRISVCAAIVMGAASVWANRDAIGGDGLSYLEMGELWMGGEWSALIHAYWSPLYPLILGLALRIFHPSAANEFALMNFVNFVVYLGAVACFQFFLKQQLRWQDSALAVEHDDAVPMPAWAMAAIGYVAFLWSSLRLIEVPSSTPDMLLAAVTYLICGLLLRIRVSPHRRRPYVALGLALAVAYFAKAVMFPLAFVFLSMALFAAGDPRRTASRTGLALAVFVVATAPYVITLSRTKGRLTLGDSGRINYAWFVNGAPAFYHWQGDPPGTGTPRHPTRRIFESPPIFEFDGPIRGTYPPWFDPSYWNEGIEARFHWKNQLDTVLRELRAYYHLLVNVQPELLAGFLILFLLGPGLRRGLHRIAGQWILLVPALATLAIYACVLVEWRYIGASIALFWVALFASVRLPDPKVAVAVVAAIILLTAVRLGASTAAEVYRHARAGSRSVNPMLLAAQELSGMGIHRGDKVGRIARLHHSPVWARAARVRVIAEIPARHERDFWTAPPDTRARALQAFARSGAKAVVAEEVSPYADTARWKKIGSTDFYIHSLDSTE